MNKQLRTLALSIMALLLIGNVAAAPALAKQQQIARCYRVCSVPDRPFAGPKFAAINISGNWDSAYGPAEFVIGEQNADGSYQLTGKWNQNGEIGIFTHGIYRPTQNGGTVRAEYFMPWKKMYGQMDGTITFGGKMMETHYKQPGDTRSWSFNRSPNHVITRL